ncbi:hypothetical protein JXA40_01980 [bacterium]|nr:hypothetical protein [candidate division CSSED10-310 bacterium]
MTRSKIFFSAVVLSLVAVMSPFTCMASGIADPTLRPGSNSLGLGAEFNFMQRTLDNEETVISASILGSLNYSILNRLGIFIKAGLFQTDTHDGYDSDWGLGVGMGFRGCIAEFQQGNIRIGLDGQAFRSQTDYSDQSVSRGTSTQEDITWTEYQASAIVSWQAYRPVILYTGIQFSGVDVEYEVSIYHWSSQTRTEEIYDVREDQNFSLLWGITYEIAEKVHLYGELKALSELSASLGFNFTF